MTATTFEPSQDHEALQDAPAATQTAAGFADLGLSEQVLDAIEDLGYENPTPIQAGAIPQVLAGRDLLAAAQTGTGKTAAFLLPTMSTLPRVKRARGRAMSVGCGPRMLIVTPTRELAQQIDAVCKKIAYHTRHTAVTVVGGVSYNPQKSALRRGCDILVATPGRLVDLIEQGACMLDEVQVLVLDEADRMLDMGFLPAVRQIVGQTRADRQTLLFSATLDEKEVGAITSLVNDPARVEIAPATSTAETVDQFLLPVSGDAKNGVLTEVLKREGTERVIVFTRTKRRADTCCRRLERAGISCAAIHGDRSQAQRERALKAFRQGRCDVLVATDVLARGIDVTDVRYVVNFDVPEEPVDYIHRIGRTGRAGEMGWALTIVTAQDIDEFYDIEALMGKTADLYDAAGIDVGENAPVVDPDRVPASKPVGKKARKRRRAKAEDKSRGERRRGGRDGGRDRGSKQERAGGERGRSGNAARNSRSDEPAADSKRFERPDGPRDEAAAEAPKPSRRKRAGKTRVRVEETSSAERGERGERADRSEGPRGERPRGERRSGGRGGKRGGSSGGAALRARAAGVYFGEVEQVEGGRRSDEGRSRGNRAGSRGNRAGSRSDRSNRTRNGEEVLSSPRDKRDTWRNYDEPTERRGRGGARGGRSGGRDNRGSYSPRGGSRRPGDRGGRR